MLAFSLLANGASTINSTDFDSYGANVGWMNWRHNEPAEGHGVIIVARENSCDWQNASGKAGIHLSGARDARALVRLSARKIAAADAFD